MKIDIGIKIDLPKLLETRALILADSGAGKSWLIRKLAEECSGKVQQIIIDPEGDFVTLREKYPFALVSKRGGDIPLNIRYAEALAHKILETGLSAIIDIYEFKQPERIEFVRVFTDALVNAPKKIRRSCIVYYDEAQMFAPEDKSAASTGAIIDICTRGRKRGLCAILATHRTSILNKNAAAQCKNKLIGSTSLPLDQKRVAHELGLYDKDEIRNLRNLDAGEFYAFGNAISKEIVKFRTGEVKTTHPKAGSKLKSIPPTPSAIRKILSKLESIPEEAEMELKSKADMMLQIKQLRQQLNQKTKTPTESLKESSLQLEIIRLKSELSTIGIKYNGLISSCKFWENGINKSISILQGLPGIKVPEGGKVSKTSVHKINSPLAKQLLSSGVPPVNDNKIIKKPLQRDNSSSEVIPEGERKILTACAQFGHGLERNQLTVLTGYKKSSRDAYILRLKNKGYVTISGGTVASTEAGESALGNFEPLPTGRELQEYWLNNLPAGEKAVLEVLIEAYPDTVTREEISERTPYKKSSRDAYILRMTAKELVEITGSGVVKASDNLF